VGGSVVARLGYGAEEARKRSSDVKVAAT